MLDVGGTMSEEELLVLGEEWKKLLRVQDWETTIHLVPPEEMEESAGHFIPFVALKGAKIEIADPAKLEPGDFRWDAELSLVHELIHCHTAQFDNTMSGTLKGARNLALEQMVEILASALVNLKRQRTIQYLQGRMDQLEETIQQLKDQK